MREEIPVKISEEETLPGHEPIVLLGPNGAGKTRHAVIMANWNNTDLIGALRSIALPVELPMESVDRSHKNLHNTLDRHRTQPWQMNEEINQVFSKLMAEHAKAAIDFRNQHKIDKSAISGETKLDQLIKLWSLLFPGRSISFLDYKPIVQSDYNTQPGEYPAQQMSDGERVALYLAGRVLDADSSIIIIDEPEIHLHSRLAAKFWDKLETIRHDCRFVYITHDLPFALSRRDAIYTNIKPNESPQIVPLEKGIPKDIAESLLSAASFSIHAKRIVFCEGVEGISLDYALYSAWFDSRDTVVVPVGSGYDVVRNAKTFSQSNLVAGVEAIGIIDRDYWPDNYFDSLHDSIKILPFHEIENILCLRGVFTAAAIHLNFPKGEVNKLYDSFLEKSKSIFVGEILTKEVSLRFRRRCEHEFRTSINSLHLSDTLSKLETQHVQAINSVDWATGPKTLFSEEQIRIQNAISDTGNDFIKLMPGKNILGLAASSLGISVSKYEELISSSLRAENDSPLKPLGEEIELVLSKFLPERTLADTT